MPSSPPPPSPARPQTHPHHVALSLVPEPAQIRIARRFGDEQLRRWGLVHLTETTRLVVSELVTNSVLHGTAGRRVVLRMSHVGDGVHLDVSGGCSDRSRLWQPGPEEEGGRGLLIVRALAERWGVSADGTSTWCTLRSAGEDGR
ncbi:ATP-binding protein [Streptomyces sp. NPDC003077]|uniref:ATP-binding protein n=1 Tax=Streptomyces sp. NPDC003077 TaxID=3154443 RepID=UPI0033B227BE